MPSRWLRACGAILAIGFGVNSLVPGLPHGCQADAAGIAPHHQAAEAPVTAPAGHEHDQAPSAPSKIPDCCVGNSCHVGRVAMPAAPHVVGLPVQLVREDRTAGRALPRRSTPRYTLPFANAPPHLA
ncbi:MAG TPA: hypothetical protein P5319_00315 [Gemmatimonadales bacterium]|nr:hypothetical protein [Gemmatimonadales bacterium]